MSKELIKLRRAKRQVLQVLDTFLDRERLKKQVAGS